ncbi:MAG: fructose-bisphosphate aldolase [Devosia sp.]|nr:fructose-bisphosphate aldolase [Devosia sp.]
MNRPDARPAEIEALRRAWRDLIVTTPNLGRCISGAILADETIRQTTLDGQPFVRALEEAGIVVGIKVDLGAKDVARFPGEKITEGLDGLRGRFADYAALGARFAKWRAVITIDRKLPSRGCIEANAHALARYAALAQEAGLVPIVEPELLMTGSHTLAECAATTEALLVSVRAVDNRPSGARRRDSETQHGAAGARRRQTGSGGGRRCGDRCMPAYSRPGRSRRHCLPVRWSERRACVGSIGCYQRSRHHSRGESTVAHDVFICACDPVTGAADLGRQGRQRVESTGCAHRGVL